MPSPAPTTLLCLPHAGGSAAIIYRDWQRLLPDWIRVRPVELAGHGRRMAEPFHRDLDAAARDLLDQVPRDGGRYALYGHSMGALLGYVLLAHASRSGLTAPQAVFLSGRKPPHLPVSQSLCALDDAAFLDRIRALGGTDPAFFDNPELVEIFLPILRSDYALIEHWQLPQSPHVSDAAFVLLHSDADPLARPEGVREWARYTRAGACDHGFTGGHFFIQAHAPAICALIADHLGGHPGDPDTCHPHQSAGRSAGCAPAGTCRKR